MSYLECRRSIKRLEWARSVKPDKMEFALTTHEADLEFFMKYKIRKYFPGFMITTNPSNSSP